MQWRDVPEWEGWYQVSDTGQVRSVDRTIAFADGRVRNYRGKILNQYNDKAGYWKVTLKANGTDWRVHVHVLVAAAFIGPRPLGKHVRHWDGDNQNNRRRNLRYGTAAENAEDTRRHGGWARPHRKLTEDQVREIRAARGKVTGRELARRYGTSPAHVCNIQLGNRRTS